MTHGYVTDSDGVMGKGKDVGDASLFLETRRAPHLLMAVLSFTRRKPMGAAGGVAIAVLILMAILAPVISPYDPLETNQSRRLQAPGGAYPLGTDQLGRDMLSRVFHGARTSLYVGIGAVLLGTILATALGVSTAYFGGAFDLAVQRLVDALMAFPWVMLMLTMMAVFGAGITNLMIALAIAMAPRNSRVLRSAVLAIKENQYFEAARAIGCSHRRIIMLYVMPNVMATIVVLITIHLGWAIIMESSMSFLGFGVPLPLPSWGRDVSEAGRRFILVAPWIGAFPGVAISIAVFGFNMLGDALRDVMDPRLRGT